MAQFDVISFLSQIFWFIALGFCGYYFFFRYSLLLVYISLKFRNYREELLRLDILLLLKNIENIGLKVSIFYKSVTEGVLSLNTSLIFWDRVNFSLQTYTEVLSTVSAVFNLFEFVAMRLYNGLNIDVIIEENLYAYYLFYICENLIFAEDELNA